jgi:hypothetical protein
MKLVTIGQQQSAGRGMTKVETVAAATHKVSGMPC